SQTSSPLRGLAGLRSARARPASRRCDGHPREPRPTSKRDPVAKRLITATRPAVPGLHRVRLADVLVAAANAGDEFAAVRVVEDVLELRLVLQVERPRLARVLDEAEDDVVEGRQRVAAEVAGEDPLPLDGLAELAPLVGDLLLLQVLLGLCEQRI